MRKLFLATLLFSISYVNAQKVGYFNSIDLLKDNITAKHIDTLLQKYIDTLKSGYTYLQDEYNDKLMKINDSAHLDEVKHNFLKSDLNFLSKEIQGYQTEAMQKLTERKNELMMPLNKKIKDAVEKIAITDKYDIIIDIASTPIYYGKKENDLTEKIKVLLK